MSPITIFFVATLIVGSYQFPANGDQTKVDVPRPSILLPTVHTSTQKDVKKPNNDDDDDSSENHNPAKINAGNIGPSVSLGSGVTSRDQRPGLSNQQRPSPFAETSDLKSGPKNTREASLIDDFQASDFTRDVRQSKPNGPPAPSAPRVAVTQRTTQKTTFPPAIGKRGTAQEGTSQATVPKIDNSTPKTVQPPIPQASNSDHRIKTRDIAYIVAAPVDDPNVFALEADPFLGRDRRIRVLPAYLG